MMRRKIVILLAIVLFDVPTATAELPGIIDPLPKGAIASIGSTRFRYPFLSKRMIVSPDGQQLAVQGHIGIWVFHIATGEVIWREPFSGIYDGYSYTCEFAGSDAIVKCHIQLDGNCLLTHFHIPSNRIVCKIQLPATHPRRTFSPDGTLFLSIDQKTLIVNDSKSGKVLVRIAAPSLNNVKATYFSPNNRTVLAVCNNGLLVFYDRILGGETGRVKRSSVPKQVLFSADGATVLAIWDSILYCYDSLTGDLIRKIILKEPSEFFALSPNGELFTLRNDKTGIDILNVNTKEYRPAIQLPDLGLLQLTTNHDGKTLFVMNDRGAILVHDAASGKRLPQSSTTEDQASPEYLYALSFQSLSHDRMIERTRTWTVWDTTTGRQTIIAQPTNRSRIDLSRDGTKTLEVEKDTIRIRDAATQAKIQQLSLRGLPEVKNIAFSNDGTAIVGNTESAIVSINLSSGKADSRQFPKNYKVEYPTYSDNGRQFALFDRGSIDHVIKSKLTVHDFNPKQPEWSIEQPLVGSTAQFAFARNDTMFLAQRLVADPDMTTPKQYLDCYDFPSRKLRHTLSDLNAYAVSPDSRLVLSALPLHHLSVIEVATGKVRMSFSHPKFDILWSAEFSHDNQRLATKMYSNVLYVWDVSSSDAPLTEPDRDGLLKAWADLSEIDAAIGFEAIRRLSKYPAKSLPFLAEKLPLANALNLDHVADWLTQLHSSDYDARQMAYRKLAAVSQQIEPLLKSIRNSTSSLEVREKAQRLLDEQCLPNRENVRVVRSVEVVERIARNPKMGLAFPSQARSIITRWASGEPGEKLTEEAKYAIERIKKIASTN